MASMISQPELDTLFSGLNSKLKALSIKAYFSDSSHFLERINNKRNVPPITINELTNIFHVLLGTKLKELNNILNNSEEYTIHAYDSNIDIWIAVNSGGMMAVKSLIRHNVLNRKPPILKIKA